MYLFLRAPKPRFYSNMQFKTGIKISLVGTAIEAVGIVLDVLHHLQIGLQTPEGLLTVNHIIITTGFLINFAGVLITLLSSRRNSLI